VPLANSMQLSVGSELSGHARPRPDWLVSSVNFVQELRSIQ
jgi:hypothetical protein